MSKQALIPDVATLASRTRPQERKPMRIAFFLALTSDALAWMFFLLAWVGDDEDPWAAFFGGLLAAFFFAACGALVSMLGLIATALGTRNRDERIGYSLIALATSLGSIVLFVVVVGVAVRSSAAPLTALIPP